MNRVLPSLHGVEITLTVPLNYDIYSFFNVLMEERHFVLEEIKNKLVSFKPHISEE